MSEDKPVFIISDMPEKSSASFKFEEDGGTLSRLIANKENRTPLVIGIYGPWGSGKTTLMETIRRKLKESPYNDKSTYRKCKTVWFQAWKYKNEDEILAALLETILITMKQDGFLGWLKGSIEEAVARLDPLKAIEGLSELIGGKIDTAKFISDLPYRGKLGFYDTFRDFFRRLLWDYLKWRFKTKNMESVSDADVALVVFVDDLDRCPSGKILQVLETIKLFLDEEGCVFVIGAAEDVIEKALQPQYQEQDARRFLEKIVQVSFHLPEIPGDQMEPFVEDLHRDLGPAVQPYLNLILPSLGNNLRRLKGFLNNLSLRQGILRGRTTPLDLELLLHWTILEYISRDFVNDVKRNGAGILLTLREKILALRPAMTAGQPWEPEEKMVKEIPQSLQVYFRNRELVQILTQFKATAEEIGQLITLSKVVKAEEEPKVMRSAADFGAMADIKAGPFIFGDQAKEANERIEKAYRIDIYPVTNREFEGFVRDGGYRKDEYWGEAGRAWRKQSSVTEPEYWKDEKWNQPDHPVVGVSFYEAEAYAKFRGKRLPDEKEWERAARGTNGRVYPWGDEFDKEKCNTRESGIGRTTPVTKYPNGISPEGCYDMAGNVWEWTASQYDKDTYVLRGGSWFYNHGFARCAYRTRGNPGYRGGDAGFRCARDGE